MVHVYFDKAVKEAKRYARQTIGFWSEQKTKNHIYSFCPEAAETEALLAQRIPKERNPSIKHI